MHFCQAHSIPKSSENNERENDKDGKRGGEIDAGTCFEDSWGLKSGHQVKATSVRLRPKTTESGQHSIVNSAWTLS